MKYLRAIYDPRKETEWEFENRIAEELAAMALPDDEVAVIVRKFVYWPCPTVDDVRRA
jgi:hypothetical protein